MKLLLITQDNLLAMAYERFLSAQGHELRLCHNALDGMSAARSFKADCILLDAALAGVNGLETLKWLRGDPWLVTVPVVLLAETLIQPKALEECTFWGAWTIFFKDKDSLQGLELKLQKLKQSKPAAASAD